MAIPDYQACMLPLLKALGDGQIHKLKELAHQLADHFGLSEEERQELLPSGPQTFVNRVGWAKTYMKNAGLVENRSRGNIQISTEGRAVLASPPAELTNDYLKKYPAFVDFWNQNHKRKSVADDLKTSPESRPEHDQTPDEAILSAYEDIRDALADDLLETMMNCTPAFFERLVIDLLIAMGYGGALPDAGMHLGRTGDGGIDGIINEDKLGLDSICVQAKRWKDGVGRPHVQAFAGSMEAHRGKKGVMITTSTFSREARDFVDRIERKIVLIDGQQLAQLMIDHNVGVAAAKTYVIKKIDSDYFIDDE